MLTRGGRIGVLMASVLFVGCGTEAEPAAERLTAPSGRSGELQPPSDSGEVQYGEIDGPDIDAGEACRRLDVVAAAEILGATLEPSAAGEAACDWRQGDEISLSVTVADRRSVIGPFQDIGRSIGAPEGLGMPAVTRDDGVGRYTVGAFAQTWYLALSAEQPPEVLVEAVAAALQPVHEGTT